MIHLKKSTLIKLVTVVIVGMLVQIGVIAYIAITAKSGRDDLKQAQVENNLKLKNAQASAQRTLVKSQRSGCRRSRLDRVDNASFQRAQSNYIFSVTGAASVKEDVKMAARKARKTFKRTSARLTKRSRINCAKAFP